jgi:hypothetical protein
MWTFRFKAAPKLNDRCGPAASTGHAGLAGPAPKRRDGSGSDGERPGAIKCLRRLDFWPLHAAPRHRSISVTTGGFCEVASQFTSQLSELASIAVNSPYGSDLVG